MKYGSKLTSLYKVTEGKNMKLYLVGSFYSSHLIYS